MAVFVCAQFMASEVVKAIARHSEPHFSASVCSFLDEGGRWVWSSAVCTTQLCFAPLICQEQYVCMCVCGVGGAVIPHFLHEGYSIHFSDSLDGFQFKS